VPGSGAWRTYTESSGSMPDPTLEAEGFHYPRTFTEWCALVCHRSVVRRGLKFAVGVGAILVAINHGDALISGELSRSSYIKMGLTVLVPYAVSVLSSVGAMLEGVGALPTDATAGGSSNP
jgi:hypothetical protein